MRLNINYSLFTWNNQHLEDLINLIHGFGFSLSVLARKKNRTSTAKFSWKSW